MIPYIWQGDNITLVVNNQSYTVHSTHINYSKLVTAIKNSDWDSIVNLVEPKKVVLEYGEGNISIQGDKMFWKDYELHSAIVSRMISMLQNGFNIEPLVLFMDNLMENPSRSAVEELYEFLEHCNLPITPDGHFLAYKRVRDDFMDVYTGTIDNSPGKTVEMPRFMVDDNRSNTCSKGLHFCSISYLNCYSGERVIIVKINPRDVVSIPIDYNFAKGRACKYTVISELGVNPEEAFNSPVQTDATQAWTINHKTIF